MIAQAREVRLDRPSSTGNERDDPQIQQRVQFRKDGEAILADERHQHRRAVSQ